MKTYKEFLNESAQLTEASMKFSDFDKWKEAVKRQNPRAEFTEEGAGGSEFVIASVKGSAQQTGKWMGKATQKSGTGYVYSRG